MEIPKMNDNLKGEYRISNRNGVKQYSRMWTKEEEDWVWQLHKKGYNNKQIAKSVDRNKVSVDIKIKRLEKKYNEYNERNLDDKYKSNLEFLKLFNKDVTILDVFCGINSFYKNKGYKAITNDKNNNIQADFHMDADAFLDFIIEKEYKFDIVDLDPFGASIPYLEKSLKIAKRGLIMTMGELGHRRFKRVDFISKYYKNINKAEDISLNNMIDYIIQYSKELGYDLEVIIKKDWRTTGRVWFLIK